MAIFVAELKILNQFSLEIYIEFAAVILGLIYLLLLMIENIWCWIFGIISSLLSVFLFIKVKLYSEAILYIFYAIAGFYGWFKWWFPRFKTGLKLPINEWAFKKHFMAVPLLAVAAWILGWFMKNYSNSDYSYIDAQTTIFSFLATYLEAQKVLSAWVYWIAINAVSTWLYFQKDLKMYGWLMVLYFLMSFAGFYSWHNRLKKQST